MGSDGERRKGREGDEEEGEAKGELLILLRNIWEIDFDFVSCWCRASERARRGFVGA